MSVTHPTLSRDTIANAVVDQLNNGNLTLHTAAKAAVVATLPLPAVAFGASSGGQAVSGLIVKDENAAGGLAVLAEFEDSGGTTIIDCVVSSTGGGGDIQLSSNNIAVGDTVDIPSITYVAPL